MTSGLKRYFIEKLASSELRALRTRMRRFDEQHHWVQNRFRQMEDLVEDRFREVEGKLQQVDVAVRAPQPDYAGPSADAVRQLRAEQRLWAQLARLPELPLSGPARSVVFVHHSYYHFYYLAQALRRRGWRALCISLEDPNGVNAPYYHGEDVNLWDADPEQLRVNAEVLFTFAKAHFELMHFAGDGLLSFFPWNFGQPSPPDIVEWRALGKKVAYTISGCNSATRQSSFHAWSGTGREHSACDNCPLQLRPELCNDEKNLAWGGQVHAHCDLVFAELQPSLDFLSSTYPNVVRGPHTMVLDENVWSDTLDIPPAFRIERRPDEVLIYHAFGNYSLRGQNGRNIKGTPAIVAAVDRLRAEGLPVRLMFFSQVPNHLVRYYQAQADIVVDQLWAGSWGANGRESMMLGKPVVGYVNTHENAPSDVLAAIAETPIVNATVDTLLEVLRALVLNPARRERLGRQSREFAMRWHSADAGAQRYEDAYDHMLARRITMEEFSA
ncbi:glycosyltransferase [Ramlibacter rhizophilus]|uniref:Glycosyltransferase n=1 Tax=Ramlibacter rhizophilus TaxID=1781167 RepID=A0A4Z0BK38_9BURK|nr:hypothetical protein [Ramlibacter rhizophilus]TFY99666.1 hypothetical protein EZ242_11000 [Ramlibacter rhizophilus]